MLFISSILYYLYKIESFTTNNSVIPLDIYQTWNTLELPPKMKECVEKLKRDNPEFKHHLYDDRMCQDFIKNNYPSDVAYAYNKLKPGAFKADLWRYCILYKKGGIYLDIKYQCEDGFKLIELTEKDFFVGEYESDESPNPMGVKPELINDFVYTGVIVSKPYNSIFNIAIQKICNNVKTKYYDKFITGQTGPALLRRCFKKDPIKNMSYGYYEVNRIGFIKHMHSPRIILSFYPEYRNEQTLFGKTMYWKDMWKNKDVYIN